MVTKAPGAPRTEARELNPVNVISDIPKLEPSKSSRVVSLQYTNMSHRYHQEPYHNRGNGSGDENIAFVLRAEEDLCLEGKEAHILRVKSGATFSARMKRGQRFSTMFRHYCKKHGLKIECLEFVFINVLQPNDTPDSIYLNTNDIIRVRPHRRAYGGGKLQFPKLSALEPSHQQYVKDLRRLLPQYNEDGDHDVTNDVTTGANVNPNVNPNVTNGDVRILVGEHEEVVMAHRAILMSRSEVFRAMLGNGSMRESTEGVVRMDGHTKKMVEKFLEFLYTNMIENLEAPECSLDDQLELLGLAEEYFCPFLKSMVESILIYQVPSVMKKDTIALLLVTSDTQKALTLQQACIDYVFKNAENILSCPEFKQDIRQSPQIMMLLFEGYSEQYCGNKRLKLDTTTIPVSPSGPSVENNTTHAQASV